MIVVGVLGSDAAGVVDIARAAAASGSAVELIGLVPGDPTWDTALFQMANAGVGHATVVRSARSSMEEADLDLALRYLPDIRCIVLVSPPPRLVDAALAGADFSGAPLVIVGPLEAETMETIEARGAATPPIVIDPPAQDPDGTFAGFVAALAHRLDRGEAPEIAFRSTVSALAVDPAPPA